MKLNSSRFKSYNWWIRLPVWINIWHTRHTLWVKWTYWCGNNYLDIFYWELLLYSPPRWNKGNNNFIGQVGQAEPQKAQRVYILCLQFSTISVTRATCRVVAESKAWSGRWIHDGPPRGKPQCIFKGKIHFIAASCGELNPIDFASPSRG